ncbi:MAG: type II secretion system secretin GspD [Gammaproteobacteria bacterium]|nr:type II secretion system secretin GspD [Gammaproteobacteria bacterium]
MISLYRTIHPLLCCLYAALLCSPVAGNAQDIDFDFEKAELRAVIQAVAEFTGRNFLVDPSVEGTVTVVAPEPLTEAEAYRVFQSVLEVNGYTTVEAAGVTKIVPQDKGKLEATFPSGRETSADDIVTQVIHLEHVRAERLVPILRPLMPAYGHLAGDAKSGALILTDRAANVARLAGIIKRLDQPARTGEVELVALTHASAEELAQLFNRLHQSGGADDSLNGMALIADPRTNNLIIKADADTRKEVKALAQELDTPASGRGNTHVVYLKNASAENLVQVLERSLGKAPDAGGNSLPQEITINADPETNALVVTATQSDFAILERVISKLDVRRLQVYVEALIAEVDTRTIREVGVQFGVGDGVRSDRRGVVGATNLSASPGTTLTEILANPLAAGAGLSLGYVDGTITLPDGTEIYNLSALAKALEGERDANVLSTPNILTMDNEEAEIVVGQNVPFVTGSYSQISQGTAVENPFQTIRRQDVGLTLRIKPQITEGNAIKLEIYQEVSNVTQRGEARDIVTNTRSLSTTIVAENNQMVVLGGLIQDEVSDNEQKVPLLGDIPVLGRLFRYENRTREKTNLLVFLRPQVIRGPADMDEPTRAKYEYLGRLTDQNVFKDTEDAQSLLEEWELITADPATDNAGPAQPQPGPGAPAVGPGRSPRLPLGGDRPITDQEA